MDRPEDHEKLRKTLDEDIHAIELELASCDWNEKPQKWAALKGDLGNALVKRDKGVRSENIMRAIEHYKDGMRMLRDDKSPVLLADTQMGLGVAYLLRGPQPRNIDRAIIYYGRAVRLYAREGGLAKMASSSARLAAAYMARIRGSEAENLERAIALYNKALTFYSEQEHPQAWARAKLDLGYALSRRIYGTIGEHLEDAIEQMEKALLVFEKYGHSSEGALAHGRLAKAYLSRLRGARAWNLESSIRHARKAASYHRKVGEWTKWAGARLALGNGYGDREAGSAARNSARARACYVGALRIFERGRHAAQFVSCQQGLGDVALRKQEWELALEAYGKSLGVAQSLPETLKAKDGQRQVSRQVSQLHIHVAYCLLHLGREQEAVEHMERSKTQLLNVRRIDRGERRVDLRWPQLSTLVPGGAALVTPLVTPVGGAALVVPGGCSTIRAEHVVWLPGLSETAVRRLLVGRPEEEAQGGWVGSYHAYRDRKAQRANLDWAYTIEETCTELWQLLMGPVAARLEKFGLGEGALVYMMVHGALSLLPLHCARDGTADSAQCFLDRFAVSFVPSGYALSRAQRGLRQRVRQSYSVLAVVDPTNELEFAREEAKRILEGFGGDGGLALEGEDATVESVLMNMSGRTHIHFCCHGQHDWYDAENSGLVMADQRLRIVSILKRCDLSKVRTVSMSACEAGLIDLRAPEEHLGLPGAFLDTGAPNVVSTLWEIFDGPAKDLMIAFYAYHVGKGLPAAQALRQAQRDTRDSALRVSGGDLRASPEGTSRLFRPSEAFSGHSSDAWTWAAFQCWGA